MKIKETPANFRVYYTQMKTAYTQEREEASSAFEGLYEEEHDLYNKVNNNLSWYADNYNLDLSKYNEFVDNTYIDGSLLRAAKYVFFRNKKDNYNIVPELYNLYNLAKQQEELHKLNKTIAFCNKVLNISLKEYTEILRTYYTEVHRQLILNGYGYVFEKNIGWTCFNRCHIIKRKPTIDYAATRKRKAELIEQGVRLYNREEKEWCEKNGIEYNAVDPRVYLNTEYEYELPLIDCTIPNGRKYKLVVSDYRATEVRGKTNDQLLEECHNNKAEICNLKVDVKTKLTLCLKADKMLYLNFIRNENQKPLNTPTTRSKDRQRLQH